MRSSPKMPLPMTLGRILVAGRFACPNQFGGLLVVLCHDLRPMSFVRHRRHSFDHHKESGSNISRTSADEKGEFRCLENVVGE